MVAALCVPAGAGAREARVVPADGERITIDRGRDAGVRQDSACEVFVEVVTGERTRRVQVARCHVVHVAGATSVARLGDQQGSVAPGYVVRLIEPHPVAATLAPGPAPAAATPAMSPAPTRPPAPIVKPVRLASDEDFHRAAERIAAGVEAAGTVLYEASFRGAGVDVGPLDQLLQIAQVQERLLFPGPWHTCFARPGPAWCSLQVATDEPVFVRLDERSYGAVRDAIRNGDADLRLVFTIRAVRRMDIPDFDPRDCVSGRPFRPSRDAWDVTASVVGGTLRAPGKGVTLLLLKADPLRTDATEIRMLDGGL